MSEIGRVAGWQEQQDGGSGETVVVRKPRCRLLSSLSATVSPPAPFLHRLIPVLASSGLAAASSPPSPPPPPSRTPPPCSVSPLLPSTWEREGLKREVKIKGSWHMDLKFIFIVLLTDMWVPFKVYFYFSATWYKDQVNLPCKCHAGRNRLGSRFATVLKVGEWVILGFTVEGCDSTTGMSRGKKIGLFLC